MESELIDSELFDNAVLDQWAWYSPLWFSYRVLRNFSWAYEVFVLLLAAIPVLFVLRWLIYRSFRQRLPVALTKRELGFDWVSLLRLVPDFFMALALACLLLAMARPQITDQQVEQWTEGIDIMLVVDISQSMEIEDFRPNRLEAAKGVARDFVNGRFRDRIGLVIFSGEAYSMSPLTTDYDLLTNYITDITFDKIENSGTAIGSALAVATNRMRDSESKSKVIILLSDGDNNAGNIDPLTAAKLADAFDIKVYTIAIGKEGRVPFGKDFFGNTNYVNNILDETTLREIAKIGNGNFYRVSNNKALEDVFGRIDELEKAEIKENRYENTTDYYYIYLRWGIVFILVWLLLKSTFMSNVLQD